ncbi:MAG: peptide chain release factor N(5)-glutamine methyltransferase [Candidatus Saccharimonadales bacterium]
MQQKSISLWLREAAQQLKETGIESSRLDAEIILAHTLKKPRTYLHAHSDQMLNPRDREIADARLDLRLDFTPIAYIIGHKEFYGRKFKVTTATLVPRPETETMIDMVKESFDSTRPLITQTTQLVDVGTGSGCIGITLKRELPELDVTLVDISQHALSVAKQNAVAHATDVQIHHGDLLREYGLPIDIICANLPYVDPVWEVSRDTHAEPRIALYARDNGLSLIKVLLLQAAQLLRPHGQLFLEADPRQHEAIVRHAKQQSFRHRETRGYIVSLTRM